MGAYGEAVEWGSYTDNFGSLVGWYPKRYSTTIKDREGRRLVTLVGTFALPHRQNREYMSGVGITHGVIQGFGLWNC